ncbi:Transposase IS4 [Popillia japonica]|uniref:Transposase IS4 n=1 Tax=Popillia japonica TaxID=7064 RepID=A0AAW1K3K9_POPJA
MGDYEDERRRLQQLWESCKSDEESEFPDVYLSDEYKPSTKQLSTIQTKQVHLQSDPTTAVIIMYTIIVNIQSVIEDVAANYSIEDDAEIASAIASNNLNWGPIDDEIINDMVYQTNLYAEQVLKETQKTKGHVKEWVPTNNREIETFFGVILWMGLMKLPRLKAYWYTNILYANKVKEVMPQNRFEQLLRIWHFNNNEDKEFANDRVRKHTFAKSLNLEKVCLCHSWDSTNTKFAQNRMQTMNSKNEQNVDALCVTPKLKTVCYAKIKDNEGRRVAQSRTPRTKWWCTSCKKSYCLSCFFETMQTMNSKNEQNVDALCVTPKLKIMKAEE